MACGSFRGSNGCAALLVMLTLVLFDWAAPVMAQFNDITTAGSGATMSRDEDRRRRIELDRRLREQERRRHMSVIEDEAPAPKAQPPEATRPMIDLVRVDVDPSEILSRAAIDAVVAPYLGKKVSLADLYTIVGGIDQLYRDAGYITAKANLPPQKVSEGIVRIQLIEARVGTVQYEGNDFTRQSFLDRRLPFTVGELVDVKRAETHLRRFNRLNDVLANLVLSPGKEPGTTDLRLKIEEPPPLEVDLALDNYGARSSGTARRGLSLSVPSVTGLRDPLTIGGYNSEGIDALYFSYEVPVTAQDTRVSLSADYSHPKELVGTTFPIDADGFSVSLSLSHPVWVDATKLARMFLSGTRRFSEFEFLVLSDPTQPREDFTTTTDIWTVEGGLIGELLDGRGMWVASATAEGVFDRDGTDEAFLKVTGSLTRHQNLFPGIWATGRINGQGVSRNNIVAAESFQAGGAFTVRGYPEAFTLADNGYLTSVQVNAMVPPQWQPVKALDEVRGFVFADHAGLINEDTDDDLTSIGVGTYVSMARAVFVELAVGVPLTDRRENGVGDLEAHLAVHFMPPVSRWLGWSP